MNWKKSWKKNWKKSWKKNWKKSWNKKIRLKCNGFAIGKIRILPCCDN
jgi:hypothetical protein